MDNPALATQNSIVILADEIFAGNRPILVIMEARSHAILRAYIAPDRKGKTWEKEGKNLQ